MSSHFQQPPLEPHDVEQYAKVTREELGKGGFRPRRRPKRAGLLVLLSFVFFVVRSSSSPPSATPATNGRLSTSRSPRPAA